MQQFFDFPVSPICTFDNFVACSGNAVALELARRISGQAGPENLLYIYGPPGSGKTHLLRAIGNARGSESEGSAPYLSCQETFSADELMMRFTAASLLLLDDLHLLPADVVLHNALWQQFNDFHSAGRTIVMTGNVPPRELPHLDDHLVSRLLWGLVARVDASDDTSRRMILLKIAEDRQIRVPDEVIDFILMTTSREVGDLIAAFEALYRMSMASKRKISLSLARETCAQPVSGETS
jgi:chromosomal replication initiator protein